MERLKQVHSHLTMNSSQHTEPAPPAPLSSKSDDYIFFGQDTVNRVSFLREDNEFIKQASTHSDTKFLIFNADAILAYDENSKVYSASYEELKTTVDEWVKYNGTADLRVNETRITFLGLDERQKSSFKYSHYSGVPIFALDIYNKPELQAQCLQEQHQNVSFFKDRKLIFNMPNYDVSLFSHAKMYLDWMKRNLHCGGCGAKNITVHAGSKLLCSSSTEQKCPVKSANVSNLSYPRSDSVIITAITTTQYDKVLLGRGKRFPGPMYSCIAGFMEPSETIEVASFREIWEETGVRAGKVEIVKSQPWPYPANLMIGCLGFVEWNGRDEVINLGHDPELADAKWVDVQELKEMLINGAQKDWTLPPGNAIAHSLIMEVIQRYDSSLRN